MKSFAFGCYSKRQSLNNIFKNGCQDFINVRVGQSVELNKDKKKVINR